MQLYEIVIFIILGFICTYSIIDRVCKCIEQTAIAKAYSKFVEANNKKDENSHKEELIKFRNAVLNGRAKEDL